MTLDPVTGLYYERNRNYSPSLGTWTSQDPLQYINGANTYQFVMGNPVNAVDPEGLAGFWGGVWSIVTAPFDWIPNLISGISHANYAGNMAQVNSGSNANYYNQIMYGHNLPANLCVGTPTQRANFNNGATAFRHLGTAPGTTAGGQPDLPTSGGDLAKGIGKDAIKKQLEK